MSVFLATGYEDAVPGRIYLDLMLEFYFHLALYNIADMAFLAPVGR